MFAAAPAEQNRTVGDLRFGDSLPDVPEKWEWGYPVPLQARIADGREYVMDLSAWRVNVVRDWTGGGAVFAPEPPGAADPASVSVLLPPHAGFPRKLDFVLDCTDSISAPAMSWSDRCTGAQRPGQTAREALANLEAREKAVNVYKLDEYLPGVWLVRRYVSDAGGGPLFSD